MVATNDILTVIYVKIRFQFNLLCFESRLGDHWVKISVRKS